MSNIQIMDRPLLDRVSAQAKESLRRRRNYNFHASDSEASHRLLNAIEPDSYIPPHCHNDPSKDETIVVLRGKLGMVFFDGKGKVIAKTVIEPQGENIGVNILHGVFHTLVALAPDSIFFESKAGPYKPLTPEERVGWAPSEDDAQAASYLESLKQLFR
jgi:cupin fold WbuC family metalloprotein